MYLHIDRVPVARFGRRTHGGRHSKIKENFGRGDWRRNQYPTSTASHHHHRRKFLHNGITEFCFLFIIRRKRLWTFNPALKNKWNQIKRGSSGAVRMAGTIWERRKKCYARCFHNKATDFSFFFFLFLFLLLSVCRRTVGQRNGVRSCGTAHRADHHLGGRKADARWGFTAVV